MQRWCKGGAEDVRGAEWRCRHGGAEVQQRFFLLVGGLSLLGVRTWPAKDKDLCLAAGIAMT